MNAMRFFFTIYVLVNGFVFYGQGNLKLGQKDITGDPDCNLWSNVTQNNQVDIDLQNNITFESSQLSPGKNYKLHIYATKVFSSSIMPISVNNMNLLKLKITSSPNSASPSSVTFNTNFNIKLTIPSLSSVFDSASNICYFNMVFDIYDVSANNTLIHKEIANFCLEGCTSNEIRDSKIAKRTSNIKLYPNPFGEILNIEIPAKTEISVLNIYNMNGQIVKTMNLTDQELFLGSHLKLRTHNLNKGLYFVRIRKNDQELLFTKLLKE
jgi:hypothetical protein